MTIIVEGCSVLVFKVELPDLTNKDTRHMVKFKFQINNK